MKRVIPLAPTQVKNAKCPADKKQVMLADGNGLYLLVRSSGLKSWQFRYQRPITKKINIAGIGTYPDIGLAKAREIATQFRALLQDGIDPIQHKKEQQKALEATYNNTFKAVAEQWFEIRKTEIKEKTAKNNWRKLEIYAFPELGNIPIDQLTAQMAIAALKPFEKQGIHEAIRKTIRLINQVMDFAINLGLIDANRLAKILKVFKKKKSESLAASAPEELPEILAAIENADINFVRKSLFYWQLHTMLRPGTAAKTQWADIDFEKKIWNIPASMMKGTELSAKPHFVPLNEHTLKILHDLRPITGRFKYVFASRTTKSGHINVETVNNLLKSLGFKGICTGHGLRSVAATTIREDTEESREKVDLALAHKVGNEVSLIYQRTTLVEKRRPMMLWWSEHIENCKKIALQEISEPVEA